MAAIVPHALTMVCKKCEKKLGTLATSDPFAKRGATSIKTSAAGPIRKETNKLLSAKAKMAGLKGGVGSPYQTKCRICKQGVHQAHSHYCQQCSYKNGICAMCGAQILDISGYKQSSK
ncbi:hypothetical protein HKX48_003841 [Thoreauomyces humboldtii]|nr:hypothetical protein HKX48_003841 [Thoreauomyces humboldtii]